MQTKLLDTILEKADEIHDKIDFPCINCQCLYLAMLSICEYLGAAGDDSFDKEEYQQLFEAVSEYKTQNKVAVPVTENTENDLKWYREFRIWLGMNTRSATEVFRFIRPQLDKLPENTKSGSEEAGQPATHKEQNAQVSEALDERTETEETETDPVDSLVRKTIELREYLLEKIVGQNYAVKSFADGFFEGELNARLEKDRKGPKAVFLFAGSPGVGKTYLATEAAKALGMPNKRFDMSGYADAGSAFQMTGADANYKSPQPGDLTGFVHDHPQSLLIFDEIEKAHHRVINLFLQVLDAGSLYDNKYAENISFRDTMIIFTTNAGKQLYQNSTNRDFSAVSKKVILEALEKDVNPETEKPFFPQAICSRLSSGYVFMLNPLKAAELSVIAARKLLEQQESLGESFSISSERCEELATTILFSLGGKCDARNITGAAKRFFANELFELFRLVPAADRIRQINWSIDVSHADPKVRELYQLPKETAFLFFGDPEKRPEAFSWNGSGRFLFARSLEEARIHLKENEISFAAIDFLYKVRGEEHYLNNEDIESEGREFFEEMKRFYPDVPLFLWETPGYSYTREEIVSLTSRGASGVLDLDFAKQDESEQQIDHLLVQLWQQRSLENLALKHQVLTYETAQMVSGDGTTGYIRVYHLQLATAVDADEQHMIVSAEEKPDLHWEDIVVSQDAKNELQYFQQYLQNPKAFLQKGAKAPKGILLYGPPGTGKTSLAKVMATEADVTFLSASADQFISKWAGVGPQSVHHIFSVARKYAPAILFIDEIDAIGGRRAGTESHDGRQEILNALLTEMDGFKAPKNKPVLVMAATNLGGNNGNTGALDPALVRRFDRSICIDLPDREGRIKLLKIICKKNAMIQISDSMLESLGERSIGMSPALIEGALNAAIREAIRTETTVTDQIMDEAFEKFNNGEEKQWDESELLKTARHEAGHAFICWYFGKTPSYLTIVARDHHGGYMQNSAEEKKGTYTKKELLDRIAVALGGRAAEIVYYGEEDGLTTGASGDLQAASAIAENMICSYGMYGNLYSGALTKNSAVANDIYASVNRIMEEQLQNAVSIIQNNRKAMDKLTEALLTGTHLNRDEINAVLEMFRIL